MDRSKVIVMLELAGNRITERLCLDLASSVRLNDANVRVNSTVNRVFMVRTR